MQILGASIYGFIRLRIGEFILEKYIKGHRIRYNIYTNTLTVGMVLQEPRMPQVLERLALQVQLLATPVGDGCAPRRGTDTNTHTHMGRRSWAGEGVESRNGTTSGNKQAAVV